MSKLIINERPLMVIPSLAARLGLNEAMILQQIHYWVSTSKHVILKVGSGFTIHIKTGRSNFRSGLRVQLTDDSFP